MRLGAPVFDKVNGPEEWAAAVKKAGYSAAYCPVGPDADDATCKAYAAAAAKADVVIAEVGAWSNPISPDEATRKQAIDKCIKGLALAERIGARCCVNIAGGRGTQWDGPHPDNMSGATFDLIVETTRKIVDAVKPTRTFYTLETMPWIFPQSADEYLRLIKVIDRKGFAAHLDPVNMVNSPVRYFRTDLLLRECFEKLGPYIRSCHAKDIALSTKLTVHLDECRPGTGGIDYRAYLSGLSKLDRDTPLMIEHLKREEYPEAAHHIRQVAKDAGLAFV